MVRKNKTSNEFDRSAGAYFKEISKCKPLSREEEFSLWERYKKNNDIEARNKLITSNLKFVASVAKKYQGRGLSYSDLIAEGNLGLIKAMDKFDGNKNIKVISYSVWWIRQTILEALDKRNSMEAEDLPTESDKSELHFESEEYTSEIEKYENDVIYYSEDSEERQKANEEKKIVSILTENLSNREKDILPKYYELDGGDPMTLEEIGGEYNITKERTRQILEKTLKKLRSEALNNSINETIYRQ